MWKGLRCGAGGRKVRKSAFRCGGTGRSRKASFNASALWGPCRKVTAEENLRAEEEISGGGKGKQVSVEFTMVETFISEGKKWDSSDLTWSLAAACL